MIDQLKERKMSRVAAMRSTRPRLFGRLLAVAVSVCLAVPFGLGVSTPNPASAVDFAGLRVQGNQLKNAAGETVRLLGVNKMGTEYACIQGWGIFDGPSDAASIAAMQTWGINTVRVPLNEDCWLNVNTSGLNTAFIGAPYRQAITDYVNLITSRGLVAIVELHWNAPGNQRASSQAPMPDADHSPAFWTSVANTFKTNDRVVLDLFNEPYPDNMNDSVAAWTCWRDGGMCASFAGSTYQVAGMQTLVNTVRATGATNVIMVPGVRYSNAMSQWLTYRPIDPLNNLAAAWHVYNFNACVTVACWNAEIAPVAAVVPLITGEIGENDCAHGFIDGLMTYLDSIGASYLAWAWNTNSCGATPALISNFDGTPTPYGAGFRDHLLSITGGGTPPTTIGSTAPPTTTATTGAPTTVAPTTIPGTTIPGTTIPGTTVASASGVRVRIENGGTDNNQQSQFHVAVANTGSTAQSGVSFRVYFTPDGSEPASKYVIEKYWDSSNGATISGPAAGPNGTYYFTVSYGAAALAAGSSWLLHVGFHLTDWASTFSGTNDYWHSGYALGLLPSSYVDTQHLPAYVNGALVWGVEPGGTEPPPPTTVVPTTVPPTTVPPTTVPPTTVPPTTVPPTTVPPTTVPPTTAPPTTASASGISVSIQNGGTDNNQQSQFRIRVENTRATSVTNLSMRVYFTLDGTNRISNYVLERYYDQSGGSTTSAPSRVSGSTYRYTISFGNRVLPANSSWEWHGSLHLVNWASTFSASNDRFHNGFAVAALPTTFTPTLNVPAFIGSTNVWGTP